MARSSATRPCTSAQQVVVRQSLQHLWRHGVAAADQGAQRRAAELGDRESSDPAVVGVVAAPHHAVLDEPVDQARHGGHRHVQGLGQVVTGGPIPLGRDQGQHLQLLHGQRDREQRLGPGGQRSPVEGGVQLVERRSRAARSTSWLIVICSFVPLAPGSTLGCPDYTADANDSPYPTYRDAVTSLTRLSLANRLIVALISIAIVVFGVLATRSLKQELLPSTQVPDRDRHRDLPRRDAADRGRQRLHAASSARSPASPGSPTSPPRPPTARRRSASTGSTGWTATRCVSDIRNAVDSTSQALPADVETDVITGSTDDIPVLLLAASTDLPLADSGELVQNVAVPALTAIDGVRQVQVTGEDTTQLTVTLRPDDLTERDLTAAAVTQTIQSQLTVVPAGTAYDKTLELAVQVGDSTELGQAGQRSLDPDQRRSGRPVRRSPTSRSSRSPSSSLARANGRPALSVSVLKEADGDSVAISHAVADALPGLQQTMGNNADVQHRLRPGAADRAVDPRPHGRGRARTRASRCW